MTLIPLGRLSTAIKRTATKACKPDLRRAGEGIGQDREIDGPHGVERQKKTRDKFDARLVIHSALMEHPHMPIAREQSQVWGVYDLLRTARLNVKYYSARLAFFQRWSFFLELALAITAPSSAVAGLWFWKTSTGQLVWTSLGVAAAFAAVIKPLLQLEKKVGAYTETLAGYRALEHDLFKIKELVVQRQAYDQGLQSDFQKALDRKGTLVSRDPEVATKKKLKQRLTEEVKKELPAAAFFVPEESIISVSMPLASGKDRL